MELLLTFAGTTPARWLGCLLIAALAGYVAIDHARHLRHARGRSGLVWLGASGLALGTGVWSSQLFQLGALQPQFTLIGPGVAAAWLAGCIASLLALGLVHWRRPTPRRMAAGAGALAATVLAGQWLLLASVQATTSSIGAAPNPAGRFLISLVIALAGSALFVFACRRRRATRRHRGRLWQGAAALTFGLMVIATQHLSTTPLNALAPFTAGGVSATALALLASVGSVVLLLVMWASSTLEAQMKASLRRTKAELARQAQCDPLTGLPNRGMLEARLAQAVRRADNARGCFAVLVIDLDGFKPINEVFGHRHGDRVLQELAARLRVMLRPDDFIARMGGDEFLLLLGNDPRPEDVSATAQAVLATLAQPFTIDGRESSMPASIGSAMYPVHGDAAMLITHADAAMRAAKSSGGATHCVFEPRMVAGAREQADLLRDLREALARQQFELYYQPKIHGPSGQITGVEALLRWHHPERGMVSPGVFIPLAERFGLIDALGEWVIDEACRQSGEWRDRGMRMRIAINLSAHQLRNVRLADHIAAALARHQVNPKLLTCEITESVAMDDGEATMSVFKRLAATGIHISIDDFGTGYSSLAYLRKLPAEELKIDRSFVLDLEGSADARAVVDAVIKLAQALGLKVVAEGVETAEQSRILRMLGCDELQGFLYARPMPAKALSLWAIDDAVPTQPLELEFRESLFADTLPAGLT